MSDYIKREDAIKEANTWSMFGDDNLESRLKRLPSADVVEVVRCKDCKYGKKNGKSPMYGLWCERFKSGENSLSVLPTDYCSYGARKEQR